MQESIQQPLVEKLKRRLATLRVGDPLDKNTDVGAINSAAQLQKIEELVAAGEQEGAEIYQPPCVLPERGYWFAPTVFTGVAQSHRIAQEEIFGPVLSVLTFRTPEEAIEKANNTAYGLSAGVWTEKGSRILWMAQRLRAGVVWANTFNRFDPTSPFGGYKESGFGREGGLHGLEPYLRFDDDDAACRSSKTYKLYLGGAFPRSESGRTYEAEGAQRRAGVAQGPARRGAGRARRARRSGPGMTAYNRGQVLYRVAEMLEARAAELAELCGGREEVERADRPRRLVRGLDRQARAGARRREPGRRAVLQLHRARADRRRRHRRAGRARAARARLAARAGARGRQRRRRRSRPRRTRARRSSSPRCSRRPTCPGGVVNILTGLRDELAPHLAVAPRRRRARPRPRRRRARARRRRERQARRVARAADGQSPYEISSFLELKTVWHPMGQ